MTHEELEKLVSHIYNRLRVEGPGKFEGQLTAHRWVYEHIVAEGLSDASAGDMDEAGKIADLVVAPLLIDENRAESDLTPEEIRHIESLAGIIFVEDAYGFVTATGYTDREEMYRDWQDLVDELEGVE